MDKETTPPRDDHQRLRSKRSRRDWARGPLDAHITSAAGFPPCETHSNLISRSAVVSKVLPWVIRGFSGGTNTMRRANLDLITGSPLGPGDTWHWYFASSSSVTGSIARLKSPVITEKKMYDGVKLLTTAGYLRDGVFRSRVNPLLFAQLINYSIPLEINYVHACALIYCHLLFVKVLFAVYPSTLVTKYYNYVLNSTWSKPRPLVLIHSQTPVLCRNLPPPLPLLFTEYHNYSIPLTHNYIFFIKNLTIFLITKVTNFFY